MIINRPFMHYHRNRKRFSIRRGAAAYIEAAKMKGSRAEIAQHQRRILRVMNLCRSQVMGVHGALERWSTWNVIFHQSRYIMIDHVVC